MNFKKFEMIFEFCIPFPSKSSAISLQDKWKSICFEGSIIFLMKESINIFKTMLKKSA